MALKLSSITYLYLVTNFVIFCHIFGGILLLLFTAYEELEAGTIAAAAASVCAGTLLALAVVKRNSWCILLYLSLSVPGAIFWSILLVRLTTGVKMNVGMSLMFDVVLLAMWVMEYCAYLYYSELSGDQSTSYGSPNSFGKGDGQVYIMETKEYPQSVSFILV